MVKEILPEAVNTVKKKLDLEDKELDVDEEDNVGTKSTKVDELEHSEKSQKIRKLNDGSS